ncbi:MAG: hypothetical protein JO056_05580 [Alphaproteobacteria bacterium]|nr:hypothetical protein [Alphaproteobacteria bacterium]
MLAKIAGLPAARAKLRVETTAIRDLKKASMLTKSPLSELYICLAEAKCLRNLR